MLIVFTLFKTFISNAIGFILKHWKAVLIVLICLYAFMQKTRYEAVVVEFEAYKANIARLADMRKIENEILRKQAVASLVDAQKTYDDNLKAIKNEYLKKQKLDSVTIGDLRSRLQNTITADSFRVPEVVTDSSWTAEQWSDSYRTLAGKYDTLALACSVTTNDYNLLRDWADASCKQVGCE
jgi:hypothetical protein